MLTRNDSRPSGLDQEPTPQPSAARVPQHTKASAATSFSCARWFARVSVECVKFMESRFAYGVLWLRAGHELVLVGCALHSLSRPRCAQLQHRRDDARLL